MGERLPGKSLYCVLRDDLIQLVKTNFDASLSHEASRTFPTSSHVWASKRDLLEDHVRFSKDMRPISPTY